MALKAGDWVQVRSKDEILGTLDAKGRLKELPFMPEMLQYCGQRFRVYKRAHKTCDTVTGTGGRKLPNGIHLDLRCDGKAHGNCQAACLLFWNEAWLKPVAGTAAPGEAWSSGMVSHNEVSANRAACTEEDVWRATRTIEPGAYGKTRYVCQATLLPRFTTRLRWWNPAQYAEDYSSGNVTLGRMIRGLSYAGYSYFSHPRLRRLAPLFEWLYDRFQALWGGGPFPRKSGTVPLGQPTPSSTLDLQPGDLVRVKSYKDILATLDTTNKNAGLLFDAEMVPFCGGVYRVKSRIDQFIDEKSGKMVSLKTPAVILDTVWCQSRYSSCRMFCPRSIYSWWRETWLERVTEKAAATEVVSAKASGLGAAHARAGLNGVHASTCSTSHAFRHTGETQIRRNPSNQDRSSA
jgi:hypothetical protein